MERLARTAVTALSAAALTLPLAPPASAAQASDPIAEHLIGPLDLSVARDGSIYVAQAFAGLLTRHGRDGGAGEVVASAEQGEIAGVDATRAGQTAYVTSGGGPAGPYARLVRLNRASGRTRVLADLARYEQTANPDGDVHYGFDGLPAGCTAPEWLGGNAGYEGIVESHPYAVTAVPGGFVVADAAGNALLMVSHTGVVSTLAVLPTHDHTFTAEEVAAVNEGIRDENAHNDPAEQDRAELPACVAGSTYAFEAVPTDVELGRDGLLYVSTLAGGPEDPSLGARSKVFTVDRRSGDVEEIGSGFLAATDLAVDGSGDVFVAELFAMQVSRLVDGGPEVFAEVPFPGALEWSERTGLIAAVDVFDEQDGGSLVLLGD